MDKNNTSSVAVTNLYTKENGSGGNTPDRPDRDSHEDPEDDLPVEIPEKETPLAKSPTVGEVPVTEDLPELDIPLADIPQTGDASLLLTMAALLSLTGLFALGLGFRKQKGI